MKWLLILLKTPTFFVSLLENTFLYTSSCIFYINLLFEILEYRNSRHAVRVAGKREKRQERKSISLRSEKIEKWEGGWVKGSWWPQLRWRRLFHPMVVKLCREEPGDSRCCGEKKQWGKYFFHQCKFQRFFHHCKQSTRAQEAHFWFVEASPRLKNWAVCSHCIANHTLLNKSGDWHWVGAWREIPTYWNRVIKANVWVLWATYLFVEPAVFLKSYTVPKQNFKADSVNDPEICFPFRSSNISKSQANWGAVEAPSSSCHWLGSELHSVLCSHLSETLRLFAP